MAKWLGKCECDFCRKQIKDILYDAKTVYGCWATMCQDCYDMNGIGRLGLGYGQKYKSNGSEFIKIGG